MELSQIYSTQAITSKSNLHMSLLCFNNVTESSDLPEIYFCRLAGAALVVPVINYRWPSLPDSLIKKDYRRRLIKWSYWILKYAPGLLHWWVTQKLFPLTSGIEKNPVFFNNRDIEVLEKTKGFPMLTRVTIR